MDLVENSSRIVGALTGSRPDEQCVLQRQSYLSGDRTQSQMLFAASQFARPQAQTPLSFAPLQPSWTPPPCPPLTPFSHLLASSRSNQIATPLGQPDEGRSTNDFLQAFQPLLATQAEQFGKLMDNKLETQTKQFAVHIISLKEELKGELTTEFNKALDDRDEKMKQFVIDYVAQNTPPSSSPAAAAGMAEQINKQMKKQFYQMDQAEQNNRGDNFIIKGIAEDSSEDLQQKIIDIVKETEVNLETTEIKSHYRMGSRGQTGRFPRPIMVKLNNRDKRTKIMIGKKKLSGGVFIEEDLTKLRSRMHYEIRKSEHTSKTWTTNGDIFAIVKDKMSGRDNKEQFSTPDDLYKLGWNKEKLEVFLTPQ